MGDIIHTLPALTDAQNKLKRIYFDWVIEENFAEIPTWHPGVNKILPINIRSLLKNWTNLFYWKKYKKFINKIQKKNYNLIIDAQGLIKNAILITNFAKGEKHGMNYSSIREPIASIFYHKKHEIAKNQHAVERIRQLFAKTLQYPLSPERGNYNIINYFKNKQKVNPYLLFIHTTSKKEKEWPKIHWKKLIKIANNENYCIKLICWTKKEFLCTQHLIKKSEKIKILTKLTLTQTAKQIINSIAVISIDTGLSHLTTALNKPNLTLYGPTNPSLIGTYGNNQKKILSKTKKMKDIEPIYVWKKFKQLLQ